MDLRKRTTDGYPGISRDQDNEAAKASISAGCTDTGSRAFAPAVSRTKSAVGLLAGLFCVTFTAVASAHAGQAPVSSITLNSGNIVMLYKTASESVTYEISPPASGSKGVFGTITVSQSAQGSSQGQISLIPQLTGLVGGLYLQSASVTSSGAGPVMLLTFINPIGTTHLTVTPFFDGDIASLRVVADKPSIYSLDLGTWKSQSNATAISVPYYSQAVSYFSSLDLFANAYFDSFNSNATTFSPTATIYAASTNNTYNVLNDVIKIVASDGIVNVFPSLNNPASPFMGKLAGRMVIDIRASTTFQAIAGQLTTLGDYGITNCVALVHTWQQMGYDNGLPSHYPANAALGGSSPMQSIQAAAQSNACLFGLHENYADYYPNYPGYTSRSTMLNLNGSQQLGWLNPVTNVQAFLTKPNLFVTDAATQSPAIHQNYNTSAIYIDVNSSMPPWARADRDASAPGVSMFSTYRNGSVSLWAHERQVTQGPVFGEGSNHWFWSGLLDGVEAQFGAESTPITDGLKAPLFVDFDLMKIHPLEVNYGMGFYNRWAAGGVNISTTTQLDAYRMQEVIFGHAAYLTDPLWSSVPYALVEQNLVPPVAKRYALQTPVQISYDLEGGWGDASAAAKAANFTIAQVAYPNGDTLIANSSPSPLSWDGLLLPQYGWAAKGENLLAYTGIVGPSIADYAATSTSLYANARNQADILSSTALAQPSMAALTLVKPGVVSLQTAWDVITPDTTENYTVFIHFVSTANTSLTAGNSNNQPTLPTSAWTTGEHVVAPSTLFYLPAGMVNGTYSVRVGLYNGNKRATLWGNNDGTLRYTVGILTVANGGAKVTFSALPVNITSPDPRLNSAGAILNFGTVRTDGMVLLEAGQGQQQGTWTLRSYPRSRDVTIQVASSLLAQPTSITCNDGSLIVPAAVTGGTYWQVDLRSKKSCTWSGADTLNIGTTP